VTLLTAAAATAVALSSNAAANAASKPTVGQAKSEVDSLRKDATAKAEDYDTAVTNEQHLQRQAGVLQDEIARQQSQVNQELETLGELAAQQYQQGSIDPTVQLMLSSDPASYLEKASSLNELSASEANLLSELKAQQAVLSQEKSQAAGELSAAQAATQQAQQAKSQAQAKLAQAQQVLDSLSASERQQVLQQEASSPGGTSSSSGSNVKIVLSGQESAAARTAMQWAESVVGKAWYAWGGSGPSTFDCSGLVMWAFGKAGVSLSHSSYADESVGTAVPSLAEALPGDIIVNEEGGHVGFYAGNGMLLSAPEYGKTVDIEPLSNFGSIVAIRRI